MQNNEIFHDLQYSARSIEANASEPLEYSDLRSESYAGFRRWPTHAFFGVVCVSFNACLLQLLLALSALKFQPELLLFLTLLRYDCIWKMHGIHSFPVNSTSLLIEIHFVRNTGN